MIKEADLPKPVSRLNCEAMLEIARAADMSAPVGDEVSEARQLACTLMQHEVVSVQTLLAVQKIQPAAALIFKEEGQITGVSGQLLLRQSAVRPLLAGEFDAVDIDLDYLCRDGDLVALGFGWGIAASTKPAGVAVGTVGGKIRRGLFPCLATFTRAVTPVGRHVALTRYGYLPLRHDDDDLMIGLPSAEELEAFSNSGERAAA
jgi:hypothetical protein